MILAQARRLMRRPKRQDVAIHLSNGAMITGVQVDRRKIDRVFKRRTVVRAALADGSVAYVNPAHVVWIDRLPPEPD